MEFNSRHFNPEPLSQFQLNLEKSIHGKGDFQRGLSSENQYDDKLKNLLLYH